MIRVVFLRTNRIDPDPRVEKEIGSLQELSDITIQAVVWDRGDKYSKCDRRLKIGNGEILVTQFGIPASWGGGMKKNLYPMIKFECKLFFWLIQNHKQYDFVHACDLLTGLPALIPCAIFKKKMVYDIFDLYAATQKGPAFILNIFKKLEYFVISKASAVIICSEKRTEQIAGSSPQNLTILHNSPSNNQLHSSGNIDLKSKRLGVMRVVYVGNLVSDRYILECIQAIKGMDNIELHIGGYGVLAEYVEEASKKYENIFFYGKLSYSQVISLERQCDIMIAFYDPTVPNHKYAAPNKFYEALSLGKPLIMFNNTGMDDIILKNDIGCTCEANVESIREAFEQLSFRRKEFGKIAEKEKKLFMSKYCWEIMGERLKKLYINL